MVQEFEKLASLFSLNSTNQLHVKQCRTEDSQRNNNVYILSVPQNACMHGMGSIAFNFTILCSASQAG